VAGVSITLLAAAPAAAEPARGNAYQTIGELEAAGYHVVVDRVGNAPLDRCTVTDVRNPQEVTRTLLVGRGEFREYITVVVSRSITVSLDCRS
jgi:hypothetical protein